MDRNNGFSVKDHTWVICAYQKSPYLEECILSLKNQTMPSKIQMVTSTPNNHINDLAEKNGIPLKINTGKSGIGEDWNFGLDSAQTELITLAHQDDRYEPDYIQTMLSVMNRAMDPILYFTNYYEIKNGQRKDKDRLLRIKRLMLIPVRLFPGQRWARRLSISFGNPICCPSVTYRRSVMDGRKFSSIFESNMDWEMMESLSQLDGGFVYVPKPLMGHRIHEASTTSKLIGKNLRTHEDYEMMRKFWPDHIAHCLSKIYANSEKSNEV